jgi:hypothetical protein
MLSAPIFEDPVHTHTHTHTNRENAFFVAIVTVLIFRFKTCFLLK